MPEVLDKGSPVLCLENVGGVSEYGEELYDYPRGLVTDKRRDKLTVDLDPEYVGGVKRKWIGDVQQCSATNSEDDLERSNGDLSRLPLSSEEAIVDALRWRFLRDRFFTYCGRVLISINPFGNVDSLYKTALANVDQGSEEDNAPHIFDLCRKAWKTRSITGRPVGIVLSGESGAGKTALARQIVRYFTPRQTEADQKFGPQAQKDPVAELLNSLQTILETFGNASTVNNASASRFGLWKQVVPTGSGFEAASNMELFLERSRVCRRKDSERNFHVFYQLLAGLSAREKQDLGLLRLEEYAYLAGHNDMAGASDGEEFTKLVPALAAIGVKSPLKDQLFRCLAGILACGNVEWDSEASVGEIPPACTQPAALQTAAGLLGLAADRFERALGSGVGGSMRGRIDSFACSLYAEVFSWLVQNCNEQMGPIAADARWIGILDLPGFESLEVNSLEQLLFNHAEERIHQLFLEKTVGEEREALASEGINLDELNLPDNSELIRLVEGAGHRPGIFPILAEQCQIDTGSDANFASACAGTLKGFDLLSTQGQAAKRFMISHTMRPVEYSAAGFRERNMMRLEEPLLEVLHNSSNAFVCELAAAARRRSSGVARTELLTGRSCLQLGEVLGLLGGGSVDLHFVKCISPNRQSRSNKDDGCFDWQHVMNACIGNGIFETLQMLRQSVRYVYRRTCSEFLTQFGAMALGSMPQMRLDQRAAVESILQSGVLTQAQLQARDAKLCEGVVLLTEECVQRLQEKTEKVEKDLTSVALLAQQAARGYASGEQLAARRDRLLKLQACVRRRRELQPELARRSTRRQFFGAVRLLQAVDLFKPRREAAITIEAHLRTALERLQYQDRLKQWRVYSLASRVAGVWRSFMAQRFLEDLKNESAAQATVSSALEAARLRVLFTRELTGERALTLQSLRRGVVGRRKASGVKDDRQSQMTLHSMVETLLCRNALTQTLTDNGVRALQSTRRGLVGRREAQDKREVGDSLRTILDACESLLLRRQLVQVRTDQATLVFQSDRRGLQAQRRVGNIKEDKDATAITAGIFSTLHLRCRTLARSTESRVVALQSMRRGKVDRRRVEELQEDKQAWGDAKSVIWTFLFRLEIIEKRTLASTYLIQNNARSYLARKRTNHLRFIRLQRSLSGVFHRMQARELVMNLQAEELLKLNTRRLCSVLEAVAWRRQHVQRRERHAVLHMQRIARGMASRIRVRHLRIVHAQETLIRALRGFQAKDQFAKISRGMDSAYLSSTIISLVQTAKMRVQYHMFKKQRHCSQLIQRIGRGFLARRRFKVILWEARAIASKTIISSVLKRFQAQGYLWAEKEDFFLEDCNILYHCMLRTLMQREKFGEYTKNLYYSTAAVKIQKYYRGWSTRRRPGIRMIKQAIDRVHLENMDRNTQRGHAAASLIQAIWRSWISRQVLLLPTVIRHLSIERNNIFDARFKDICGLKGFRGAIPTEKASQINAGGAHLANMCVNYYGEIRKEHFRNWVAAIAAIDHRGDTTLDFAIGKHHAVASCVSGAVYTYYPPETFQDHWRQYDGCISAGADILVATMTLHEAKKKASSLWDCQGFCFQKPLHIGMTSDTPIKVFFKSKFDVGIETDKWTSFKKEEEGYPTEDDFKLSPLSFREALRDPTPRITKVCCGEGHALLLSDQGLVFTWGRNSRGQCGVGKHLPEQVYLSATCLQQWAIQPAIGSKPNEPLRAQLPRIRTIACGPNHSGVVDAEGVLWFWGEHQGVGLFNLRASRGNLGNIPSFLLFRISQEMSVRRVEAKKTLAKAPPAPAPVPKTSLNPYFAIQQVAGDKKKPLGEDSSEEAESEQPDMEGLATTTKVMSGFKFGTDEIGSLRRMLNEAQDVCAVKEVSGDIQMPTRCCNIVLSAIAEAPRLRAAGTPVLDCWGGMEDWCAPVFTAPARGCKFVDVEIGPGLNCALSDKGYLYTWGIPSRGMLGRPVAIKNRPSAPERVPLFPQLAISLAQIAVGREHIVALTTHGRVFTWGKVDACLGASGFQRCTLEEPMFIEGMLRELRVVKVAAGRMESAIATEDFDAVLGWEMLEMSPVGHRMLPVCFQYTFTGPRSGFDDLKFDRLWAAQSEAVHLLFVGGPVSRTPHLHGMDAYPKDDNAVQGHQFTRKNDGWKKKMESQPTRKKPVTKGLAKKEIFQWAARSVQGRKSSITDPRLKRAAAAMVSPSFAARRRDILEVDRDLCGFRRLALSRHDSNVIGVDSDCYKDHDYEAYEEDPDDLEDIDEEVASYVDSIDGVHRRRSSMERRPNGQQTLRPPISATASNYSR